MTWKQKPLYYVEQEPLHYLTCRLQTISLIKLMKLQIRELTTTRPAPSVHPMGLELPNELRPPLSSHPVQLSLTLEFVLYLFYKFKEFVGLSPMCNHLNHRVQLR